jgi:hypothetical protein
MLCALFLAGCLRSSLPTCANGGVCPAGGDGCAADCHSTDWHKHVDVPLRPPVSDAVMVHDAARANVVLFGGRTEVGASSDTWIWDGTRWQLQSPPVSPGRASTMRWRTTAPATGPCCSAA